MKTRSEFLLVAFLMMLAPGPLSPANSADAFEVIPLGEVRVTKYTHVECHSRVTSSGYVLSDKDEGKVCAISRDWWRGLIQPGDLVWVSGYAQPCVARDTMALANRKGFPQRHWIDIYITDPKVGLDFGIRHAAAYVLKPRAKRA